MSGVKRPFSTIFISTILFLLFLICAASIQAQIDPTRLDSLKKAINDSAQRRAGIVARMIRTRNDSVSQLVLEQYREAEKHRKLAPDRATRSHQPGYVVLAGFVVLTLGLVVSQSRRKT